MLSDLGNIVVDMLLYCPNCGMQHIDRSDAPSDREWAAQSAGDREIQYWTNPPHRTHLCRPEDGCCGHRWRPSDVHTNGVLRITSKGVNDSPFVAPVRTKVRQ